MSGRSVRARVQPGGQQLVEVLISGGYHPSSIVARAGLPLRLTFRRRDQDACFERVVFSSPHIDRRVSVTGTTIVDLPSQPPGEVRFTCGMGRYRGRIELVAEATPSLLDRVRHSAVRMGGRTGTSLLRLLSGRSPEIT